MNLTVIGTGYVGLVTGACFAERGNKVICVDNNLEKLDSLKQGIIPIFEPGLQDIVVKNSSNGNLSFTDDLQGSVEKSDIIFFCLPTPTLEDGTSDTKYIVDVASKIGHFIKNYKIIVNKSTVPIGTTEKIFDIVSKDTEVEFDVASNPEFLREGFAVKDFMNPDRVVIGSMSDRSKQVLSDLYANFVYSKEQILLMDPSSSEMSKYAANAFLATKITFINEIANICYRFGANVDYVKKCLGMDDRIGNKFLNPGIGFGGSCFPKDIYALKTSSQEYNYDFKLLNATIQANNYQITDFINRIITYFNANNLPKKVTLWGLTFKPDTDDLRESPALKIIERLNTEGFTIKVYDPQGMDNLKIFYPDLKVEFTEDIYSSLLGSYSLVVATEWKEFVNADLNKIKTNLELATIFDGRNIFDLENPNLSNFNYFSIGRNDINNSIA